MPPAEEAKPEDGTKAESVASKKMWNWKTAAKEKAEKEKAAQVDKLNPKAEEFKPDEANVEEVHVEVGSDDDSDEEDEDEYHEHEGVSYQLFDCELTDIKTGKVIGKIEGGEVTLTKKGAKLHAKNVEAKDK